MKRKPSTRYGAPPAKRYARAVPRPVGLSRVYGRPGILEVKSCDMVSAGAALGAAAAVVGAEPAAAYTGMTEVNLIRQGATVAQRIGNKVVIKSLDLWAMVNSSTTGYGVARVMLVYDRQPNGAFPAIGDIILSQPSASVSDFSGINMANKSRFQMIRDEAVVTSGVTGPHAVILHWFCKGKWEVEFGADAGAITDFRTGAIYLIAYYTHNYVNVPSIADIHCRVRYYD